MKKLMTSLCALAVFSTQAAEQEHVQASKELQHYLSAGLTTFSSNHSGNDVDAKGVGFTWNYIQPQAKFGYGISTEFVSNDLNENGTGYDEVMWSVSANLPYRFESKPWLIVYPSVGITYYQLDRTGAVERSDSETGFNIGFGASADIPDTQFFTEMSYKYHKMSGELFENVDVSSFYVGVGYRF